MAYIKISDPNIIDLSAWHQVINVVNQHSDSITAITNNFDEYFGAPNGQIYFFMEGGDCQVEVYINGVIYSSGDYGSGYNTLTVPILKSSDVIRIDFDIQVSM